jgi:hypothetical protein
VQPAGGHLPVRADEPGTADEPVGRDRATPCIGRDAKRSSRRDGNPFRSANMADGL